MGESLDTLPVGDCFFFGASSANQRIENWWLRLRCGQLEWWIVYFRYLESNGFFVSGQISDTVVLFNVWSQVVIVRGAVKHERGRITREALADCSSDTN